MRNAAERMSSLVEGLLDYSRVTTRARPFEIVHIDQVLAEVLTDLEARIQETNAVINVGTMPARVADRLQMRQIFQNLLSNALKFHPPDRSPNIDVTSQYNSDGSWSISVKDDGIGFDEIYADRIFRPFQRLHGRNEYEGSGMGLAICRKIIARHGGTLAVRSKPGKGSIFTFTLPARPKEEPINEQITADDYSHSRG
jgi:signal transduction histidine kinase